MAPLNNYPVDRSTFRIIQGVQNSILFMVRDLDRRTVSVADFQTATIYITDPRSETLLMSRTLVPNGQQFVLTIMPSETANWPLGPLRYGIVAVRNDSTSTMLWTSMNYSPYSTLQLTPGPIPGPAPTLTFTWPGDTPPSLMELSDNNYYTSALPGAALYGFNNGMQTFNITMTNFSGGIRIDGSLLSMPVDDPASPDWAQVDLQTYSSFTGNVTLNEQGNYLWMRMVAIPAYGNLGTVDQTQYKR